MGKTGWIVLIIVLLYLFKDRLLGQAVPGAASPMTGPAYPAAPPSYYYGAPPPGPNWASSPPTHVSQGPNAWSAATALINAGGAALNTYINSGGGAGSGGTSSWDPGFADSLPVD